MAIETSVNIDVNVDGTATVKQAAQGFEDLGDAVAKTQREAEALALQYGLTDQRTQDAIKRAGMYKTQLESLDYAIDNAKVSSEALFRSTQALIGGFQAVVGSVAIFAGESEDLQRILLKVQASMAIAQGIKDWNEFSGALRQLASVIGERLVVAFSSLRAAIASTGIGIAVIAVGTLIAKFVTLQEETKNAAKEQKDYNEEVAKLRREREQLQKGDEQYTRDELKRVSERLAAGQRELAEKVAARRKYLRDLSLLGVEEADSDKLRAETNLKEIALNNERLVNERLKLSNKVAELDKQAADKAKSERAANNNIEKKEVDEFGAYIQREKQKRERELRTFSSKQLEETDILAQNQLQKVTITLDAIQQKQKSTLELSQLFVKAYGEELVGTFVNVFGAISALQTAFAGEDESRQRKAFETRKKLALVQASISTIEATIAAFKSAQESPLTAVLPAYPFIQAAAAAAYGLAQIQQIRNQTFSGGQVSAPSPNQGANVPSVQVRSSSLPQTQDILSTNRQVYVLEGDITRTQRRVASNQSVSVLGG
jgi:hypothetical protein